MNQQQFSEQFNVPIPKIRVKLILLGVAVIFLLIGAKTCIYTVQAEEEGVVLRFGEYLKTVKPGLRFKIPFGVDIVTPLPVRRQLKQEFGFGTTGASVPFQYSSDPREQEQEKQMVTGDLNSALVEWVIQYRIDEPRDYLFNVRSPDATLRYASESIMREVVGDRTIDEVITIGRQEIESETLTKLQELVNAYAMGLTINQVQLKNVNPPQPVQASFNEVNNAQQEKEQLINEANAEYNRVVPKAEGEADQTIRAAEGYAMERINEAEGDANRFEAVLTEYIKAPEVTRRRLYLETIGEVIPSLGSKIIIDDETKNLLPLLNLNAPAQ